MTSLQTVLSLIAPPRCPGCDLPCGGLRSAFCGACLPLLEGAPSALLPPQRAAALFLYAGPLADAIRRFKYAGRTDLVRPLCGLMLGAAQHYRGDVDRVVPMPLHTGRLRERGFNQATLLARPLAHALGAVFDVDLLHRTRPTDVQAGLEAGARLANVRGAFAVPRVARRDRVLLVDDVRTSGATLASAALCLRAAGVPEVWTLALATVPPGAVSAGPHARAVGS